MTKIRNIPQRLYKLFAVVLAVTLVCLITLNSKAENVIVEQETNPDLEFMTINSGAFPTWKVNSSFSQNGEGSYSLNSNTCGFGPRRITGITPTSSMVLTTAHRPTSPKK